MDPGVPGVSGTRGMDSKVRTPRVDLSGGSEPQGGTRAEPSQPVQADSWERSPRPGLHPCFLYSYLSVILQLPGASAHINRHRNGLGGS